MASLRQLRGRLRSIQSTKQIMRAMQLVSASKLKRAQGRLMQARAVLEFLDGLLQRVVAGPATGNTSSPARNVPARSLATGFLQHPLAAPREGPSVLVVFTSDAGLAGAYNTNLIQTAEGYLRRPSTDAQGGVLSEVEGRRDAARRTQIICIGKKGYRYFTKRGWPALASYLDLAGRPHLARAEEIGRALMGRFLAGGLSDVQLVYSRFISSSVYRPTILKWLPIQLISDTGSKPVSDIGYLFEPSPERVFEDLLPRWALAKFQLVMLEAFTSEHSARMVAMKNATDNAEELLKALTLQRNKIRQAAITKEISEIVGTAGALT